MAVHILWHFATVNRMKIVSERLKTIQTKIFLEQFLCNNEILFLVIKTFAQCVTLKALWYLVASDCVRY